MANASLQSFRRTVTVNWPKHQDDQAKELLLKTAMAGHEKTMREQTARAGYAPDFDAYANHPGNTDLRSVVLPGPIVFKYRYVREVVSEILKALRAASPITNGDYVRGHTIFVNGVAVPQLPARLKHGDEVMISNPVPYARRIEIGKTESGRAFVMQVPNRIYARVAQRMATRYRNSAHIEFDYVNLSDAYIGKGKLRGRYAYTDRKGIKRSRARSPRKGAVQSPAIIIGTLS